MLNVQEFFDDDQSHDGLIARLVKGAEGQGLEQRLGHALRVVLDDNQISMFGSPYNPVSSVIRAAVVVKAPHPHTPRAHVQFVDLNGLLMSASLDFEAGERVSNETALRVLSREHAAVIRGERPPLPPALAMEHPVQGLNHFSTAFRGRANEVSASMATKFSDAWWRENHVRDTVGSRAQAALRNMTKRRLGACRKTLLDALDPEVRRVMYVTLASDVALMSRITGADHDTYHPEWKRRRAEAMKVFQQYPAFLPLISKPGSRLLEEIDRYGDFRTGISAQTGLTQRQVEALRGRSVHALINVQGSRVVNPGDRGFALRRARDDFEPYRSYPPDVLRACHPGALYGLWAARGGSETQPPTRGKCALLTDNAWEIKRDPNLRASFTRKDNKVAEMRDTTHFLCAEVLTPLARTVADPGAYEALCDLALPRTARQLLAASEHYHQRFSLTDFRKAFEESTVDWAPLLGREECGEVSVVEITSRAGLLEQGRREGHCVGGYDHHVLHRQGDLKARVVLSVNKGQGVLSTADVLFSVEQGRPRAQVLQHYARFNRDPSAEAVAALGAALRSFGGRLDEDLMTRYLDGLPAPGVPKTRPVPTVTAWHSVWGMVTPMLSKSARKVSPEELMNAVAKRLAGEGAGRMMAA